MESQGGRGGRGGGSSAGPPATDEIRFLTLARLEELLKLLVDRYGARMTLGELLAVTAFMARLCQTDRVSIAEIAEATGLPKQNLSRWAQKRVGETIALEVNEERSANA